MKRKKGPFKLPILKFFFMTLVLIVSLKLQIVEAHLYPGPISSSLGGAEVVNIDATEGPFFNPAILPHLKNDFQASWVFGQGSTTETRDDRYWGLQLTDCTKEIFFPAAAAYVVSRTTFGNLEPVDEKYFLFGGAGFLWRDISVGISLNRRESQFPIREKLVQNNFIFGAVWPVKSNFAFGFVFQNPARPSGEIPNYLVLKSKIGIGIYYVYQEKFHLRLDITQELNDNPNHHMALGGGIESRFMQFVAARLGYRKDYLNNQNLLTAGFGFLGPRLSLSYGYQIENQSAASRHIFDLQLPF